MGGGGEPRLTAEEAAVAALDNARAAAAKLKVREQAVDRFGLGHITLGLQMEGKDNAWLWRAGNGMGGQQLPPEQRRPRAA